jgi:predicted CopG family antitoxin
MKEEAKKEQKKKREEELKEMKKLDQDSFSNIIMPHYEKNEKLNIY